MTESAVISSLRVCLWCGNGLGDDMRPSARFCSDNHRVAAYRERSRLTKKAGHPVPHSIDHAEGDPWARVREQHSVIEVKLAEIAALRESYGDLETRAARLHSSEVRLAADNEGLRRHVAELEKSVASDGSGPTDGRAWINGAASYVRENFREKRA